MESEKKETFEDLRKVIEHLQHENERLEKQFDAATNELVKWNREAIEKQKNSFLQFQFESLEAALRHISYRASHAIEQKDKDVFPSYFRTVMEDIAETAKDALEGTDG